VRRIDLAWAYRQQRLRSIERLNLALFVDAQNQLAFGRRKVKADDVAHFFDERGISRQLEGLGAMRLKAESLRDAMDGRWRESDRARHRAQAPVRPSRGVVSSVSRIVSAIASSPICRGAPGLAERAIETMLGNRRRHLPTVLGPRQRES
jgi:hypothetical protein